MSAVTLAIAGFCGGAIAAEQRADSKASNKAAAAPKQRSTKAPKAAESSAAPAGMVVSIDPATGQIRQPDAAEIGQITAQQSVADALGAAKAPEPFPVPGGGVGLKLGTNSLTYTVVTVSPSGKLETECVTGEKAAIARTARASSAKSK